MTFILFCTWSSSLFVCLIICILCFAHYNMLPNFAHLWAKTCNPKTVHEEQKKRTFDGNIFSFVCHCTLCLWCVSVRFLRWCSKKKTLIHPHIYMQNVQYSILIHNAANVRTCGVINVCARELILMKKLKEWKMTKMMWWF